MRIYCCQHCELATNSQGEAQTHGATTGHIYFETLPSERVPAMLLRRTVGYINCIGTDEQQALAEQYLTIEAEGGDGTAQVLSELRKSIKRDERFAEHFVILQRASIEGAPSDGMDVIRIDTSRMIPEHALLLAGAMRRHGWSLWLAQQKLGFVIMSHERRPRAKTIAELNKAMASFPDCKMQFWAGASDTER